jgi:hypothetical protein
VFNLQGIRKHVKRSHDLTLDGYREAYNAFTGGNKVKKGRPTKSNKEEEEEGEKVNSENCLFHEMDDNKQEENNEEDDTDEDVTDDAHHMEDHDDPHL